MSWGSTFANINRRLKIFHFLICLTQMLALVVVCALVYDCDYALIVPREYLFCFKFPFDMCLCLIHFCKTVCTVIGQAKIQRVREYTMYCRVSIFFRNIVPGNV